MVGNQRVPDAPPARSADHLDAQPAHLAEMLRHTLGRPARGTAVPGAGSSMESQHCSITRSAFRQPESCRRPRRSRKSNSSQTRRQRSLRLENRSRSRSAVILATPSESPRMRWIWDCCRIAQRPLPEMTLLCSVPPLTTRRS